MGGWTIMSMWPGAEIERSPTATSNTAGGSSFSPGDLPMIVLCSW